LTTIPADKAALEKAQRIVTGGGRGFAPGERALLEAALALAAGNKGQALALVFGAAAREDRSLRPLARQLAAGLGAELPDFGWLPPAFLSFAAALIAAGFAIGFLVVSRLRRKPPPWLMVVSAVILALFLVGLGAAALVASAERRALTFSDRLYTLPSTDSELTLTVEPGRTGRVIGQVTEPGGDWVCLVFRDGATGWVPDDMLDYW
jgi:hypothetical protein